VPGARSLRIDAIEALALAFRAVLDVDFTQRLFEGAGQVAVHALGRRLHVQSVTGRDGPAGGKHEIRDVKAQCPGGPVHGQNDLTFRELLAGQRADVMPLLRNSTMGACPAKPVTRITSQDRSGTGRREVVRRTKYSCPGSTS